jgi:hypothetical protein
MYVQTTSFLPALVVLRNPSAAAAAAAAAAMARKRRWNELSGRTPRLNYNNLDKEQIGRRKRRSGTGGEWVSFCTV